MKNKQNLFVVVGICVALLISIGSLSYSIYAYNNPKVIYVKGEDGKDGLPGRDGKDGANGIDGKDGINGIDGTNGKDGIDGAPGKDGVDGKDGTNGRNGSTGPKGETGAPGKDGSSFLTGKGIPSNTLGSNDDTYLDLEKFNLYVKEGGEWVIKGNIKGEKGDKGDKGNPGQDRELVVSEEENNEHKILISNTITGGEITCEKSSAFEGDIVTFVIAPDYGKHLDKLYINNEEHNFDEPALDASTFEIEYQMQNYDIFVDAIFEEPLI